MSFHSCTYQAIPSHPIPNYTKPYTSIPSRSNAIPTIPSHHPIPYQAKSKSNPKVPPPKASIVPSRARTSPVATPLQKITPRLSAGPPRRPAQENHQGPPRPAQPSSPRPPHAPPSLPQIRSSLSRLSHRTDDLPFNDTREKHALKACFLPRIATIPPPTLSRLL